MKVKLTEAVWLEERGMLTLRELAECSGLSEAELRDLVSLGALEPIDPTAQQWYFAARCIVSARAACRLRNDFELDPDGLALVMSLLDRVEALESELKRLHAHVPRLPRMRR
jgi:chaperone modulatory protein CbpM